MLTNKCQNTKPEMTLCGCPGKAWLTVSTGLVKKNNACTVKPRYNDMGYNKLMNIMKQS